jgi:hypothetical protein
MSSWEYYPKEFSSYEEYVKYLKEKGFAVEATEENNPYKEKVMTNKLMTNKEKFEAIGQITVQDVIDWLDGRAVSYVPTQRQHDGISGQYCSKKVCHTVFSKEKYGRMFLSNGWWLDNRKPFLEEFSKKKNEHWDTLSNNSVRRCKTVDDMMRMIVRCLSGHIHFKVHGRSYDYINVKNILAKDGHTVYTHDKSEEIKALHSKIWELEKEKKRLETELHELEHYQSIHTGLETAVKDTYHTEGNHCL